MASDMNKEEHTDELACEYEKQRLSFIADLRRFNANRGTPFDRIPEIGGQEVELYHLYQRVTALGGWHKVNSEQLWEDFQEDFGLPKACVNGPQALKNIYFRYLNVYEKVNFLGEDPDTGHHEEEEGPARKKICLPIETIPLSYNYNQHNLTDAQRQQHNLCRDRYEPSQFEKLEMSLRSGLPNEVDMAVNMCVLLSTEGKHCMKLEKTSQMLRLLLAHVGIFEGDSEDLQDLYQKCWTPCTGRNFLRFWYETVETDDVRALIRWRGKPYKQRQLIGCDVLNLGRDLGVLDVEGQRVLQLAVFIHNLSFEDANQKILAKSFVVHKFLMLSLHSKLGGLKQIAVDTMANLSCELSLDAMEGVSSRLVVNLVSNSLFSEDRFLLVRGLEIVSKLSQLTSNETILLENLKENVYTRLIALLTVQDIQLIVHTLETLYKLSKVGEPFTTRIARVHKAIDTLVSLITIEAQSFGPGSLVGIKVVEYVPPAHTTNEDGETVKRATTVIQPINPDSINIYQVPSASAHGLVAAAPDSGGGGGPGGGSKPAPKAKEPVTDIHTTTSNWLNATYELKKRSKVNQVELFSEYLQFCRKFGINNAMSSADFLHLVKVTYHQCEVVSINRKNGDRDVFLEGLCKRSTQKPFAVTTLPPEKVPNPLSVNVSPKQTPSQVVDPLAHTPTLRQRLMEPPRVSLHPPLPHAGATPGQGATKTSGQTNSPSTPVNAGKAGISVPAKIIKNGKGQTIIPAVVKAGNQPSPPLGQKILTSVNAAQGTNPAAVHAFPSISQALQMDQGDSLSVKSLLAKKLSQGVGDSDLAPLPGPNNLAGQPVVGQALSSTTHNLSHLPASSVGNSVASIAIGSSQATVIQNRPVSQTVSSNSSFALSALPLPAACTSSPSLPQQTTVSTNSLANVHAQNSIGPVGVTQNNNQSNQQININTSLIQNSLTNALAQHVNQNSGVYLQQNSGLPTALQNSTVTFVQRNNANNNSNSQSAQFSVVQQNVRHPEMAQNVNLSVVPQQQQSPVNVQLVQQSANGSNLAVVSQNSSVAGVYQTQASIPCAIMPKTVGPGQQPSSSVAAGAIHPQCSSTSSPSSQLQTSLTVNHLIRNPSNMIVANQQAGSTPHSSAPVSMAAAANIPSTPITQSISSPAVAALLTSNSQQPSQMIISSPMLAGQIPQGSVVQRPQTGQTPTTVVIQTPPGTIVMPSRQVVVQGNGTTTFGSLQQGSQGGTVSFYVPPQYRQGSSVTVQGLNIIQQQAGVNVVPSLAIANTSSQPQAPTILQQNLVQAAQNQPNLVQPAISVANQLGPRQIVLSPNQTSIPVGVQISSLAGNLVRSSPNICIPAQQQQPGFVIRSSVVSSNQSLPQPANSTGVAMNISHSQTSIQIPSQASESQPARPVSNVSHLLQQQQQPVSFNNSTSPAVVSGTVTNLPNQNQQTVVSSQCNGVGHDVNGVLGSPESVCSDFPPSPLSTGISSDKEIPNGKLSESDKDIVIKRNDINKFVEKNSKVNGFVYPVDATSDPSKQNPALVSESPGPHPQGSSTDPSSSVIVNGCMSAPAQGSNLVGQRLNIPVEAGSLKSNGIISQSPNHPHVAGNSLAQTNQVVVTNLQQNQNLGLVQPQQSQQLQQQHQRPAQLQQSQQLHKSQQLQQSPQLQQPLQQVQQQQIHPQTQHIQQPHHPQQQFQRLQQQLQPSNQQFTISQQSFQQQSQAIRPQQGNVNSQLNTQLQTGNIPNQPQNQVRPRISTLSCPPPTHTTANGNVRPVLNRDTSRDSDASNDSMASATGDQTPTMITGQATQTPTVSAPNNSRKKPKPKKGEVTPVPEKLPARSRKKPNAVEPGTPIPKPIQINMEYMCEWASCRRCFSSSRMVFLHVFRFHLPKSAESSCQWVNCEKLIRKRWSLVSHVQDHHCSEMAMRTACQRRYTASQQQASGASPTPPPAPHQPMIYPPDAAMQAIRRFSIKQPYPEFADQREGPVSKHIRLTAALILRNISHHSSLGRRLIRRHEQELSYNTMNSVEASTALAHCLWEIMQCCEKQRSPSVKS